MVKSLFVAAYVNRTPTDAGTVADMVAYRKTKNWTPLPVYMFQPVAVKNLGTFGLYTLDFLMELGRQICTQSGEVSETSSVVTVSKILLSVGFGRFLQGKPRFSVRFRFLSVPFSPCRQYGTFTRPTAHQTCSSTLHISVYNSSRQQQVSNSV